MTPNTLPQRDEPHLAFQENDEDVELQWPEPKTTVDEALLMAFKTWVLRFILSPMATPNQILNAMRRLEVMKEFPLRQEKQSRTLALAEARVELRRRALELREAQLKENRERREATAARAEASAKARAEKAAEKAAKADAEGAREKQPDVVPSNGDQFRPVSSCADVKGGVTLLPLHEPEPKIWPAICNPCTSHPETRTS